MRKLFAWLCLLAGLFVIGLVGVIYSKAVSPQTFPPNLMAAGDVSSGATTETASSPAPVAEPSEADLAAWKAQMTAACAAPDASVQVTHFDINQDKRPDTICLRSFKVAPYGEYVDVQARVHSSGQDQTAYILLPVDGGRQVAVCMAEKGYALEETSWEPGALKDLLGSDVDLRPVSITVAGGNCDPPWLFWPKDAKGDEVQFDFARM